MDIGKLREVTQLVMEVVDIESQPGGAFDPNTPSTLSLDDLKTALQTYLYNKRHPLAKYTAPLLIAAGTLWAGSLLGKRKRK